MTRPKIVPIDPEDDHNGYSNPWWIGCTFVLVCCLGIAALVAIVLSYQN